MPTLDNNFDDGTGAQPPEPISKFKRDDASIVDRNTKIEDMRKRVEKQLAALVEGNDLNALQQQVAELRTTTTPKASTDFHFDTNFEYNSSALPGSDGSTERTYASNYKNAESAEETEFIKYVDDTDMTDPYGDQGVYTGEISSVTTKPNGLGTMRYADGRTFSGGWNHSQWHGKGTFC
jgi:hypothetical protein